MHLLSMYHTLPSVSVPFKIKLFTAIRHLTARLSKFAIRQPTLCLAVVGGFAEKQTGRVNRMRKRSGATRYTACYSYATLSLPSAVMPKLAPPRLPAQRSMPRTGSLRTEQNCAMSSENARSNDGPLSRAITRSRMKVLVVGYRQRRPRPGEDDSEELRKRFAHLQYSNEDMDDFIDYLRGPYDVAPIPSKRKIQKSSVQEYSSGCYLRDSDTIRFSRTNNPTYQAGDDPDDEVGYQDMCFLGDVLSGSMLHRRVALRRVVITKEHKSRIPEVEEDVGETGVIVEMLSTHDLPNGHLPTVKKLGMVWS
ncbi:hypothetical protein EIP91_001935 [Steccherinum ochraceum]|uniref:Uncharacterized protein n=1 Tax=Steccherinum ochraceum TaxID=92696 RepID=A0A4R0RQA1_9APHY|nr:hypothetical protein EIP91_001935 [Steccherinum ochraceum]